MRQYIWAIFLLLVSSALANENQEKEEEGVKRELKHDEWAPVHYKAYATAGEHVGHEEVLKLLKELQKIYEPYDDKETNGRKTKVNKLIELSQMDVRKCSRAYLREFHDLVDRHFSYKRSMWPYLKHHFREYISLCEKHVLHTNVDNIDQRHRTGMAELASLLTKVEVDGIVLSKLGQIPMSLDHLREGILSFMEDHDEGKFTIDSQSKFSTLFDGQVMEMCSAWTQATDSARGMNEFYVDVAFDDEETKWLEYGTLCHAIERGKSRLVPILYRRFKRINLGPRFKRLKSMFKKLNCFNHSAVAD